MEDNTTSTPKHKPPENTDSTTWHLPAGAIGRLARGRVSDMSFSPDGRHIAVATPIGCWLYVRPSLKPLALFETESGMVNTIVFSSDARLIATSNLDGVVKVWDTQTLKCLAKINHRKNVEATSGYFWQLCFSQDNQYLAASCFDKQNVVYAWRKNTDEPIKNFPIDVEDTRGHDFPIYFSPIENLLGYVSAGTPHHTLTISDIETGEHIAHLSQSSALSSYRYLVFSPCGQYIATANRNNEVLVWNVYNGTLETEIIAYEGKRVIPAYTSDSTLRIADIYEYKVVIWDAIRKEKIDTFEREKPPHDHFISGHHVHFSPDGAHIATILSRSKLCGWTVGSPSSTVSSPANHKPAVYSVAFSIKGKTIASGHGYGMYHIYWDATKRQTEQILPTPNIQAQRTTLTENLTEEEKQQWYRVSALSPCGERLALRDLPRGSVEIWDIVSETLITELADSDRFRSWREMRFSPTGEYFIDTAIGDINVWNTQSGKKVNTLTGDNRLILTTAFHPDGKQLAAAAKGSAGMLWDIVSGEQLGVFPTELPEDFSLYRGNPEQIQQYIQLKKKIIKQYKCIPNKLAFSRCGTIIACGIQDHIRLRDAATLETRMLILLPETCSKPFALTFSPCGKYLVSGSWWIKGLDRVSIRIWEIATGQNIHTFWGHTTDVQDLAFSPDGELLASGSFDGTILLWDMKPFLNIA
ncbi:MAG: WD40 repeat domain-containing protein [Candidatus Poribacteria bacterium]|nr:WD40 repeat domain-containing protein [Candidatus Poribacteria bacterium]